MTATKTTPARTTKTVFGAEVITLSAPAGVHSRDFVEIEPVRLEGDTVEALYDDRHRGHSKMNVAGPGDLSLEANPDYVAGAYANLRHHQARQALGRAGFDCTPGLVHLFPIEVAGMISTCVDLETDGAGNLVTDLRAEATFASAMSSAATAAAKGNATHIAVRIS